MQRNKYAIEILWIIFITAVLFFVSYAPIVENYWATSTDRYYFGQSEYPLDMVGDLAYVRQGYLGRTLASFNYSTLLGAHPTILKIEYILIGQIGRILHISPINMFIISRLAISLGIFVILYVIIHSIFSEPWKRIVSYLFALFGAGIMLPGGQNVLSGYDTQVFLRLTQAMPHYLLGTGLMLLSLYFIAATLERPERKNQFLWALLVGVTASLIYAPDSLFLISCFPLYVVFDSLSTYIRTKGVGIDNVKVGILFAYSMVTVIPILYVRYVTIYIWNDINTVRMESLLPFRVLPYQYILVVGVVYLLSLVALPSVLRKGKPLLTILATWVVMHPVAVYIFAPMLHLNYVFFFIPYFVAFGILGAYGLATVSGWVGKLIPKIPKRIILWILVGLVLLTSTGIYVQVWQAEHVCFCIGQYFDFGYPKKSLTNGIFWLSLNTKPDDIVLSYYFAGVLIPGFSGNRVYVSWWYRLIEPSSLNFTEVTLQTFYSGHMPDKEAYAFVKRENISYVLYSEQEQGFSAGARNLSYPFLIQRYNKDGTIIYQVR